MPLRGVEYINSGSKRRLDICGAVVIGLASLPVSSAAMAGIAIETRSFNPLFIQKRVGRGGLPLNTFKIRTLPKQGEDKELDIFGTFDPRASKFGRFLRQNGIDEIPQLYSVIKGDMSLVGFRPLLAEDIEQFHDADPKLFNDWYEYFTACRPGLVSSSSIYRHGIVEMTPDVRRQSMIFDIGDAEQASLTNDLRLLASTPMRLIQANAHVHEHAADLQ